MAVLSIQSSVEAISEDVNVRKKLNTSAQLCVVEEQEFPQSVDST